MIDHLFHFEDEASCNAVFPPPADGAPAWLDERGTVMPVRLVVADAEYDPELDAITTPEEVATGHWIACRCESKSDALIAMAECLTVTDTVRAKAGEPYVLLSRIQPDTPLARVEPVFAGDSYPWPPGATGTFLQENLVALP
jgi:hypothetical protein